MIDLARPGRLALLVLALAVWGAAAWVVSRRRRAAERAFASPQMLGSVAPHRPGPARWAVPAGLLVATALAGVAVAGPQRETTSTRERSTILVALDTSSSMLATDVAPDRFTAAKDALRDFLAALPPSVDVGLVVFNAGTRLVSAPTDDHDAVAQALDELRLFGGTSLGDALTASVAALGAAPAGTARVVLVADGGSTTGSPVQDGVAAAVDAGVPVDTVAYGTADGVVTSQGRQVPVPTDPVVLAEVAQATGGTAYQAATGDELAAVVEGIGQESVVRTVTEPLAGHVSALAAGALLATALPVLAVRGRLL